MFLFWFADPVNEYPSDKAVHPSAEFVPRVVDIVVRTSHFHDNCPRADVDNATLLPEAATDRHHPDQISDCDLPGRNRLPDQDHGFGQQHRVGMNPIWAACSATVVIALYGPTVGVIDAFCYTVYSFAFRNAFLGNFRVDDFWQPCIHSCPARAGPRLAGRAGPQPVGRAGSGFYNSLWAGPGAGLKLAGAGRAPAGK